MRDKDNHESTKGRKHERRRGGIMKKAILLGLILVGVMVFSSLVTCHLSLSSEAQAQTMNVTLAWDPNSETDLAGYRIYWSQTSGAYVAADRVEIPLTSLSDRTHPQAIVLGLDNTKRWHFVATAYDAEGRESLYSNEVWAQWDGVTGIPPAAPGMLKPVEIIVKRPDGSEIRIIIP